MPATSELQGTVLDGSGAGGRVFLDLNGDGRRDGAEPAASYGKDGRFELEAGPRSMAELAAAVLVAEDAGGGPKLMAPATAFLQPGLGGYLSARQAVVSALSTLVAAEVLANGLTAHEAAETVAAQLRLEPGDPLRDYGKGGDPLLRKVASAAAVALAHAQSLPMAAPHEQVQATAAMLPQVAGVVQSLALHEPGVQAPATATIAQSLAAQPSPQLQQLLAGMGHTEGQPVRLIVRMRKGAGDAAEQGQALADRHGGQMRHRFTRAIRGFAVAVPEAQADDFLASALASPDVESVEADSPVQALGTQSGATWGLDRIDQRSLPLDGSYSYSRTASRVRAYIIDSGIRADHREFGGRVVSGYTAVNDGWGTGDCHGHGTHVAGTVGGSTWGVAKGVTLVPVRVLDCGGSGYVSDIVAALDWMIANAQLPAVANMSLGGLASEAMDDAVQRALDAGITVVVAAGNSSANACNYSPARAPSALTVGATTAGDERAWFSNYGTCLDLFAPGYEVTSASSDSDRASVTMNGTSMAAPHAAGLAAIYLHDNASATPEEVMAAVTSVATMHKVSNGGAGSPDALLYTNLGNPAAQPAPPISSPISSPISAPTPPAPQEPIVAVGALTGYSWLNGKSWGAHVTIAVVDGSGNPVPKVKVAGMFSFGGKSKKATCTTATNGTCVAKLGKISLEVAETTFSVTVLKKKKYLYDPANDALNTLTVHAPS